MGSERVARAISQAEMSRFVYLEFSCDIPIFVAKKNQINTSTVPCHTAITKTFSRKRHIIARHLHPNTQCVLTMYELTLKTPN